MNSVFVCVLLRDLKLASRRRIDALLPLAFFLVALSLFPLGVGPEPQTLRQIAPGIVWVCVASAKCAAHWLLTGLPLIVATPLAGLAFNMSGPAVAALLFSLVLGTPILSLLGGLGAALTLGLRSGGMLLILIVLPLATPALIFGAGAVVTVEAGMSASGHFSLLGALLIVTTLGAPLATAAALRISTE